ncbi:ADP-ribosylglycohydrolase family protein [Coccidioides posadasii C735 delta SOWgp]|uniref:ADP-ribosylhydrolase ARH3 n=2 Tax=Coccidioides posadasii TaxID=199306 RepID=A0A0J6FTG4_COCPO|nr:ADP-ribosylglycohydrolase family protein [Coccidioides posadasii C735 delta SOWgp]EER26690.1 ADP-ribosylglycohydrolase family protein [Coccidioides posadasii C735 delta SOWgp]KMM72670.1 ADP-ribosylglycohydrolase family protein [Coccidioides posadasii RMSCC 3488]|eukprot:XP_003068835.1 ADP-ribosylglycohydrolase family protein [Coccidioides posadasii C735 delta SOWgp]
MTPPRKHSKIKGSIFGVAVVDALGGPVEFHRRGSFAKVTGYRHNANFGVPPGTWTDDTSMTLCLAQALIESKGTFVSQAAIRNYIKWWKEGYLSSTGYCFDIGAGTASALGIWLRFFQRRASIREDDPDADNDEQPEIDRALKREIFCGNGSLMRVSPVGLVYSHDLDQALSVALRSSMVTHPYPTCAECCMLYTKLIVCAVNGGTKEDIAREFASTPFNDQNVRLRFLKYTGLTDWMATEERTIESTGFVISTLEAALWSFFTTSSFQEGALRAVNLGHDADTVGAVYGGLAGAFYGFESIPAEWLEGLQRKDIIEEISSGLVSLNVEAGMASSC